MTPAADGARRTAVERLADQLRHDVLSGRFAPGQALREESLAERFSASRHTVRSALSLLAGERLLTAEPYRGVRVTEFDGEQVAALQDLRRALESEAVRLHSLAAVGGAWSQESRRVIATAIVGLERCERASPRDWVAVERAHAAVHLAIVETAGSPRITETYRGLNAELALLLLHTRAAYDDGALAEQHRHYLADLQRVGVEAVVTHIGDSSALLARRAGRG